MIYTGLVLLCGFNFCDNLFIEGRLFTTPFTYRYSTEVVLIILQMIILFSKPQSNFQLKNPVMSAGLNILLKFNFNDNLLLKDGCLQPPAHTATQQKLF